MASVNTNVGAIVALQYLNETNASLKTVQTRITTGLKVASAKDNAATWAIAQSQRAQAQSLNAVKDSLQRGISTVDVASTAAGKVSDLLLQAKEKALAASDVSLDQASRDSLEDEYRALIGQIKTVVKNAKFNGTNLLAGATSADPGTTVKALANDTGADTIDVAGVNLQVDAAGVNVNDAATVFDTAAAALTELGQVDAAITKVSATLAALGTGSKALESHLGFVNKLQGSLKEGIGNLVDADLAEESANLQALQVKQQLGIQALAIANQAPQTLLSLFQ